MPATLPPPLSSPPDARDATLFTQCLGNELYPRVHTLVGESLAGKITGMILEMPLEAIITTLATDDSVKATVGEAMAALPPQMLDLMGASASAEGGAPSPLVPSPVSMIAGPTALTGDWGDLDDEEDGGDLPPLQAMIAAEQAKKAQRAMLAAGDDTAEPMQTDEDASASGGTTDAYVCEWDAAAWATQSTDDLCTFVAGRLEEPQVRIIRAVVEETGAATALALLAEVERCMAHGGMLVAETGKPRTKGGIFVKLLRDATPDTIGAEAQAAALGRIKREGAEAKKEKTKAQTARRAAQAGKRNSAAAGVPHAAPSAPAPGRPKVEVEAPSVGDFAAFPALAR